MYGYFVSGCISQSNYLPLSIVCQRGWGHLSQPWMAWRVHQRFVERLCNADSWLLPCPVMLSYCKATIHIFGLNIQVLCHINWAIASCLLAFPATLQSLENLQLSLLWFFPPLILTSWNALCPPESSTPTSPMLSLKPPLTNLGTTLAELKLCSQHPDCLILLFLCSVVIQVLLGFSKASSYHNCVHHFIIQYIYIYGWSSLANWKLLIWVHFFSFMLAWYPKPEDYKLVEDRDLGKVKM